MFREDDHHGPKVLKHADVEIGKGNRPPTPTEELVKSIRESETFPRNLYPGRCADPGSGARDIAGDIADAARYANPGTRDPRMEDLLDTVPEDDVHTKRLLEEVQRAVNEGLGFLFGVLDTLITRRVTARLLKWDEQAQVRYNLGRTAADDWRWLMEEFTRERAQTHHEFDILKEQMKALASNVPWHTHPAVCRVLQPGTGSPAGKW